MKFAKGVVQCCRIPPTRIRAFSVPMSSDVLAALSKHPDTLGLSCFDLLERFSCFASAIRRIPSSRPRSRAPSFGFRFASGPAVRSFGRVGYDRGKACRRPCLRNPSAAKRDAFGPFNADRAVCRSLRPSHQIRTFPAAAFEARCLQEIAWQTLPCRGCRVQIRAQGCRGTRPAFLQPPTIIPVKCSDGGPFFQTAPMLGKKGSRLRACLDYLPNALPPRFPKRRQRIAHSARGFHPGGEPSRTSSMPAIRGQRDQARPIPRY